MNFEHRWKPFFLPAGRYKQIPHYFPKKSEYLLGRGELLDMVSQSDAIFPLNKWIKASCFDIY
jgi:hypothetical protein